MKKIFKMNFFNFIFVNFILFLWKAFAEIHVNNIDLRPPKWNDIGLIFGEIYLNLRKKTAIKINFPFQM